MMYHLACAQVLGHGSEQFIKRLPNHYEFFLLPLEGQVYPRSIR